jgi:hypothetical protein
MKFKNPLPIYEQHYNNYDEYIVKKSAAGNQLMMGDNALASKVHATKIDPKVPTFRVLSCHSVVSQLST